MSWKITVSPTAIVSEAGANEFPELLTVKVLDLAVPKMRNIKM